MKNIVFYNHWHYGDLFTTRGMVADIKSQLPDFKFSYAHTKNKYATRDLCTFDLSPEMNDKILSSIDQRVRIANSDDTIYINAWVGAYEGMWQGKHPPYTDHYKIFNLIYQSLNASFNLNLKFGDIWDYIPEINYDYFDAGASLNFTQQRRGRIFLFCNNEVHSKQSDMGNMREIISALSAKYPTDTFVVTDKVDVELWDKHYTNVFFTNDIFKRDNDLCEISYLSKQASVIVGKNSSPFTYTQTKSNLLDKGKTFVCFSHEESDTLPYGMEHPSKFVFSNSIDDMSCVDLLDDIFKNSEINL